MIIKFKIERNVNVSKDVCLWNTWDHEHLPYVHKQFGDSKIIFENQYVAFIKTKMKMPFLPFKFNSLHTLSVLPDNNVLVIDTFPLNIIAELKMEYIEISEKKTKLINTYKLDVPLLLYPFKKIFKIFIKKWNQNNWNEDLPVKIRRMKAIDMGFQDFQGIKSNNKTAKYKLKLPLPRLKDSHLNEK